MNKKGQAIGIGIIIGIFIFIIGFAVLNVMKPEVTTARSAEGLNCVNATNISDGTKLTCLTVDLAIPLIIWGILSLFAGVTISRVIR